MRMNNDDRSNWRGANIARLREAIRAECASTRRQRAQNPAFAFGSPRDVELEITHRCNLHCAFCFQRTELEKAEGRSKTVPYGDLEVSMFEQILQDTRDDVAGLYIQGGEPLVHPQWPRFARLLEADPRTLRLSTNGLSLAQQMESLVRISGQLTIVLSVHGLRESIEAYYGNPGLYSKLLDNLGLLMRLKREQLFQGKVIIHCVLNEHLTGKLAAFVRWCEETGVDGVIISAPWYISQEAASRMDIFFRDHLGWLMTIPQQVKPSWYKFSFRLSPHSLEPVCAEIRDVAAREFAMPVQFHPAGDIEQMKRHLRGEPRTTVRRPFCLNIIKQLFVLPHGGVSACRVFQEFQVGNLHQERAWEIWNGATFARVRRIMNTAFDDGTWPIEVCAKCNLLSENQL